MTLERLAAEIDEETLLVSVPHVSYRTGARIDVPEVAALAHERGALMMLDAYQTAGSLPLDVRALGVDLLATGALKYLLGSAGLAYMWCADEVVERVVPTATGWFAAADIFAMDAWRYAPARAARRFEMRHPAGAGALRGRRGPGPDRGARTGSDRGARARPHRPAARRRRRAGRARRHAVLSGRADVHRRDGRRGAGRARSTADGVIASSRDASLRVSLHAYNDTSDIDAVLAGLAKHRALLA